jgi:glyoxylase-like metal-dependent hydrolase (beta-lactamase superfamily II)
MIEFKGTSEGNVAIPTYEVYALKYAERDGRRPAHFVGGDPHDVPMPMDYYVWLVRDAERLVLVDTGFDAAMAEKRGRQLLRTPAEALSLLGVTADAIPDIVITHLHNDHVGTFFDFPKARFHIQDSEMEYVSGRYMTHEHLRRPYEADHVAGMVRALFDGHLVFHAGDDEIAPGITVHHIGGHTAGLQCVRVPTRRGWLVLASDASHYYEHFERGTCFPVTFHLGQVLEGYRTLKRLADSPRHIVPGHDPLVLRRYPPAAPSLEGIIARLDLEPQY